MVDCRIKNHRHGYNHHPAGDRSDSGRDNRCNIDRDGRCDSDWNSRCDSSQDGKTGHHADHRHGVSGRIKPDTGNDSQNALIDSLIVSGACLASLGTCA